MRSIHQQWLVCNQCQDVHCQMHPCYLECSVSAAQINQKHSESCLHPYQPQSSVRARGVSDQAPFQNPQVKCKGDKMMLSSLKMLGCQLH